MIRKRDRGGVPGISTASLPDVIFMILFFFMVSTTMRRHDILVHYRLPGASEVERLEKKSLASHIYIGVPVSALRSSLGSQPRIQLNGSFRDVSDIGAFVASEREKLGEANRGDMTINISADASTPMGLVTDVKQELRRAGALRISYAATRK